MEDTFNRDLRSDEFLTTLHVLSDHFGVSLYELIVGDFVQWDEGTVRRRALEICSSQ